MVNVDVKLKMVKPGNFVYFLKVGGAFGRDQKNQEKSRLKVPPF